MEIPNISIAKSPYNKYGMHDLFAPIEVVPEFINLNPDKKFEQVCFIMQCSLFNKMFLLACLIVMFYLYAGQTSGML